MSRKPATTPNEREALGIDYVDYVLARDKADSNMKRRLRGRFALDESGKPIRQRKGYKNRHVRRAGLAEARRERRRECRAKARAEKRERAAWRKQSPGWHPRCSDLTALERPAAEMIAKHARDGDWGDPTPGLTVPERLRLAKRKHAGDV